MSVRRGGMATGPTAGIIHPTPTRRSNYIYLFYTKHHGGDPRAAQWSISRDLEFAVFDSADFHDFSDERGWLYGTGRDADGGLLELGTWGQQVAEFPYARPGENWHGCPLWPLKEHGPENRKAERHRPAGEVFARMEATNVLTPRERKRLYKGDHA